MTRTFCAVIGDVETDRVLSQCGELCAKARHWSFKQVHVPGRPVSDVKREAMRRFGLAARQFMYGPARNRPRGEWRCWRGVRRLPREGVKPARTAGSGKGTALKGGRRRPAANSGPNPGGERAGHVPSPARGAVALASGTNG